MRSFFKCLVERDSKVSSGAMSEGLPADPPLFIRNKTMPRVLVSKAKNKVTFQPFLNLTWYLKSLIIIWLQQCKGSHMATTSGPDLPATALATEHKYRRKVKQKEHDHY